MKQDVIIRWLMESVNADELAQANENGETISYFAGVARRFPTNEAQATTPTRRPARPAPAVAEDRAEEPTPVRRQPRQTAAAPAVNLNETNETAETTTQPRTTARRAPAQRQAGGEDRVRVGGY